eukprot:264239-Pyramimonas_sp.AAC.1
MAPIAPCARSASSPSVLLPPPPPSLLPPSSSPLSGASHRGLPRIISRQQVRRHDEQTPRRGSGNGVEDENLVFNVRSIFLTTCEPCGNFREPQ